MLGKVSAQPSVGHWKVLPEQRNRAEIQHQPGSKTPPVELQHLPRSPRSRPALGSTSQRNSHQLSFTPRFATSRWKKGHPEATQGVPALPSRDCVGL